MQLDEDKLTIEPPESTSEGRLLALLTGGLYALFSLLPDSHSLMVAWPWVFVWQMAIAAPMLWWLWQVWQQERIVKLGSGWDWVLGIAIVGISISTLFAVFPNQARWYGWAALGAIAALYALNNWLRDSQRRYNLLVAQGILAFVFVLLSLSLWGAQTWLPELRRLAAIQAEYGINLAFDFSTLELRNWALPGHQNYVAGYLLLVLPLFVGLGILSKGWMRGVWFLATALGVIDFYTTSSRGGWLGLAAMVPIAIAILLSRSRLPRWGMLLAGGGAIAALVALALTNNRLASFVTRLVSGEDVGGISYRLITGTVGWRMGITHLISGVGLGGVPLLYQNYLPVWAGREAELTFQLHSTPPQLWAEMGIWGILAMGGAIALLLYHAWRWHFSDIECERSDRVFVSSICVGLIGYSVLSLTDYQLDNLCIAGTLVIYLACLASERRSRPQVSGADFIVLKDTRKAKGVALFGIGLFVAASVWLAPIHLAWQRSQIAFSVLADTETLEEAYPLFEDFLKRSQRLAPWEPYYPYQLGWFSGNLALELEDPQAQQQAIANGIEFLAQGNRLSPHREFGRTNLAWLYVTQQNFGAAAENFARSAELVPAKRSVFFGLGLTLVVQGQIELAVEAMVLEILRDPLFATSPIWRSPGLFSNIYPQVLQQVDRAYEELLQADATTETLEQYLHRARGGLAWWRGDRETARTELEISGSPLARLLLALEAGEVPETLGSSPGELAIAAWFEPENRDNLLRQAWVKAQKIAPLEALIAPAIAGMEASPTFEAWLRENPPTRRYRRSRPGFEIVSRHADGLDPVDYQTIFENAAIVDLFPEILPSPKYFPPLDRALQPRREVLLEAIS